jgi:hypothetical protein
MQIVDVLTSAQGGAAIDNLARSFNLDPEIAETAVRALVPQLTRTMERNTLSRGGLADLLQCLGQGDRQRYLEPGASLVSTNTIEDGNSILELILGSKNMSRKMAERAARETGLQAALLKQLLPAIASLVMGGLSKEAAGPLGDLMQRMGLAGSPLPLPGEPPLQPSPSPHSGEGQPHPPAGGGSARREAPLPIPGDDLPGLNRRGGGLDDLSDILRRGRQAGPVQLPDGPSGGGTLWSIVRSILAGVLGFQSRGFLSWLVRLVVFRWGLGFLQRLLSRILTGR